VNKLLPIACIVMTVAAVGANLSSLFVSRSGIFSGSAMWGKGRSNGKVPMGKSGYHGKHIFIVADKDVDAASAPLSLVDGMTIVACQINGVDARLIIDTGSNFNCLFADHLEKFGLQITGQDKRSYTAAGALVGDHTLGYVMKFGDNVHLVTTFTSVLPPYPKHGIDGIMGNYMLARMNATLDYKAGRLTFNLPK
jgi:hypothetical protein